ncbi:MAG: L-histidine N(alpha)-methyltransferase [Rhodospirillales bacterium]
MTDPEIVRVALEGLLAPRKTLPPFLFYDEEGCRLFYRITELPEYYLTRTERALLNEIGPAIAAEAGPDAILVEYGASHEEKAVYLLGSPGAFQGYIPIDVAGPELERLRERMVDSHPDIVVQPMVADFMQPIVLPSLALGAPVLGFFPGSTIGNLDPAAATAFLDRARTTLGRGARFLLGADLRKAPSVLIPAYDDAAGVTAAFNMNLLMRLNREAGADFNPLFFRHSVLWNDGASRIEMHLESVRDQIVRIAGTSIRFAEGETIHTENSYKHPPERILALARAAGWTELRRWTDPAARFGHFLLGQD